MIKIDFYYWADQCPYNCKMIEILNEFLDDKRCKINLLDISKNKDIARRLNIYSPNMLVVDDKLRWHGPISISNLERILNGVIPEAKYYNVPMSNIVITGNIKDLTEETIKDTCLLCSPSKETSYCKEKSQWISSIREKYNLPNMGKLHYLNNRCIGGAEFIPSLEVPYPIPKAKDTAFLSCSFVTSEEGDFKYYPLQKLEEEISKLGFKYIVAIASENTPFPNGPLSWFLDRGYVDVGFLYYEERHFSKMHLVKKNLVEL